MKTRVVILAALGLVSSLVEAQTVSSLPQSLMERLRETRKYVRHLASSPSLRTQQTYVVDSLYYDTLSPTSWDEVSLTTFAYYPNGKLWIDSGFAKSSSTWEPQSETRYYYKTNLKDSIIVNYNFDTDQNLWIPSDSTVFLYQVSGNVSQEIELNHSYDTAANRWDTISRLISFYSGNPLRLDSAYLDSYVDTTASWLNVAKIYYKYNSQNLLDSIKSVFSFLQFIDLYQLSKLSYDGLGRIILINDSSYLVLSGSSPSPSGASDQFFFYRSPTSPQLLQDSTVTRDYSNGTSPQISTQVSRYSYNAIDSLDQVVYEECNPTCTPRSRDRYRYKMLSSALRKPPVVPVRSIQVRSGEFISLPESRIGASYQVYQLNGQLTQQGLLGQPGLHAPERPGIYLLFVGQEVYRLAVTP